VPAAFSASPSSPAARKRSFLTKAPTPAEVAAATAELATEEAAVAAEVMASLRGVSTRTGMV